MISPLVTPPRSSAVASWQQAVKEAVRDVGELCRLLDLPAEFERRSRGGRPAVSAVCSAAVFGRIRPADPADPLLRQVLPLEAETLPPKVLQPIRSTIARPHSSRACCANTPAEC